MEQKTFEAVVAANHEIKTLTKIQKQIVLPAKVGEWLYLVSVDSKAASCEYQLYRASGDLNSDAELLPWAEDD